MSSTEKKNPKGRRIGLVIVNTGNGKGKTTAALGTAFRAVGVGFKVKMIQFIKGSWDYGELHSAQKLGFEIVPMGEGFTWETKDRERDMAVAWKTWESCREAIEKNEHDLLIFDEINNAIAYGYLDVKPVLEALRISAEVVNNLPMKRAVEDAALRVREGAPIGKSLAARKLFPPMMIHLISSGESSGELEKMLERAASNQEREMDGLLSTMTNLLGPFMVVFMGAVVMFIVIALLLPIFQLNDLVK